MSGIGRLRFASVVCFALVWAMQGPADANDATGQSEAMPTQSIVSADQARSTVQRLINMSIRLLPHEYEGTKNWENKKKVWAGVKFRRDGLKISTKRRWKELRHGQQTRYRVAFPGDASTRPPLVATVRSVVYSSNTGDGHPGWNIDCDMATPLDFTARIERWNRGVQIYSVEVSGHMRVRLNLSGRITSYPDYSELPPAIVIDPLIHSAAFHLDELNVDRVSKIGGEVAETWGEIAEKIVNDVMMDDINEKLHAKLNKAIDKKRDRLRFSASDWLTELTAGR